MSNISSSSSSNPENTPPTLVSLDSRIKPLEAQIQRLTHSVDRLKVQQRNSICRCSSRFPSCCSPQFSLAHSCCCGTSQCRCTDLRTAKTRKGKDCGCKGQNLSPTCTCEEGACKCATSDAKDKNGGCGCSSSGDQACACPPGECKCFSDENAAAAMGATSGANPCAPSCQCGASGSPQVAGCQCNAFYCPCTGSGSSKVCQCVAVNCGCAGDENSLQCTCVPGECRCDVANMRSSCVGGQRGGSRMCRRLLMQANHCACLLSSCKCANNVFSTPCMYARANHEGCQARRFIHRTCLCQSTIGCGFSSRSCGCVSGQSACLCLNRC